MNDFIKQHVGAHYRISEINDGANSQVFEITTRNHVYILKRHMPNALESSKKCQREYQFLEYTSSLGQTHTAKPIAACQQKGLLLMSKLPGIPVEKPEYDNTIAAFDFIEKINLNLKKNHSLNYAQDAIFTLQDFATLVQTRIDRFMRNIPDNEIYREFIVECVIPQYHEILAGNKDLDWEQSLACQFISPSDFGFHNILNDKGHHYFFDFEYAGVDSLWKLVADFFAQPKIPVPIEHITILQQKHKFRFLQVHKSAFITAYKLTRLKWCFIMGGIYSPDILKRRQFSGAASNQLLTSHMVNIKQYFERSEAQVKILKTIL